jgi:hypothetical protein
MEEKTNTTGQNLGIAALITAIVTFVLAVIPCVGIIAIIPGIIAIVLASVGLSHASRNELPRGVLIAALIIGTVAVLISLSQIFVAGDIAKKAEKKWSGEIHKVIKEVHEDVLRDLEDATVSIKIESNGEKVEINTHLNRKDLLEELEKLEELEEVNTEEDDTLQTEK